MKNFAKGLLSNFLGERDYFNNLIRPINNSVYIKKKLTELLADCGVSLKFKPIVCLDTREVYGMEVYICWNRSPALFLNLATDDFLEMFDKFNLAIPMEMWILEAALEQASAWRRNFGQLVVTLNISLNQIRDQEFIRNVKGICGVTRFPSELVEFEVSESKLVQNPCNISKLLDSFLNQGFGLSVDQFGLSSFSSNFFGKQALKKVKFSSRLISLLASDKLIHDHVKHMCELAIDKKILVAADGITSKIIADKARNVGCSYGQGLYFGEPLTASEFTKLLETTNVSAKLC